MEFSLKLERTQTLATPQALARRPECLSANALREKGQSYADGLEEEVLDFSRSL